MCSVDFAALSLVGRGGVFSAGGRGTLEFAVGRVAVLGVLGRAPAAVFGVLGRVAGTSTGWFVAFTTPGPLNDPGLAVAAIAG